MRVTKGPLSELDADLCACDMRTQTLFLAHSGLNHTHEWMMKRFPEHWARIDAWGRRVFHGNACVMSVGGTMWGLQGGYLAMVGIRDHIRSALAGASSGGGGGGAPPEVGGAHGARMGPSWFRSHRLDADELEAVRPHSSRHTAEQGSMRAAFDT